MKLHPRPLGSKNTYTPVARPTTLHTAGRCAHPCGHHRLTLIRLYTKCKIRKKYKCLSRVKSFSNMRLLKEERNKSALMHKIISRRNTVDLGPNPSLWIRFGSDKQPMCCIQILHHQSGKNRFGIKIRCGVR